MQPAKRRGLGGCRYVGKAAAAAIDVSELVDAPRIVAAVSTPDADGVPSDDVWLSPDVPFITAPLAMISHAFVIVSCLPDRTSMKSLVDGFIE